MTSFKILGWILLILGLAVILYSLFASYNIFTSKSQPPTIFKIEEKEEKAALPQKEIAKSPEEEVKKMVEEQLKEQVEEIIPADFLSKLLNLVSWSILAGILIFGGTQISGLGINLIKK